MRPFLPGMDEKDVSVTLSNGVLTLKGEKKSEREEKKEDYHLMERSYGSFQRSFRLGVPCTVTQRLLYLNLLSRTASEKTIGHGPALEIGRALVYRPEGSL
jgi:hypothetical protein